MASNPVLVLAVWGKAQPAYLLGPDYAFDELNNLIQLSAYGDHSSPYGWEIDHRHPKALGGTDDLDNLRPLHHRANSTLGAHLGNALSPRPRGLFG